MTQKMDQNKGARARPERQAASAQHSNLPYCYAKAWEPDGPALRFHELLKVVRFGRSTAYKVIKEDPTFPKGTPLFDTPRSPRIWWYAEVIAWLHQRAAKASTNTSISTSTKGEAHV